MQKLELGITTFAEVMEDPKTKEIISYDKRIRQVVDEIKLADQIGLDYFGVGESITIVSLGASHSSAVTSTGRIFTWGNNIFSQLGDGTIIDKYNPTEITNHFNLVVGETIKIVELGHWHSAAVSSNNRIFTWGRNENGQLGDGTIINRSSPTEIVNYLFLNNEEMIDTVSTGGFHSAFLSSTGRFLIWGWDSYGQLGDSNIFSEIITPTEITNINSSNNFNETYVYLSKANVNITVMEGFTFSGWYSDINMTIVYIITTMPAQDLVLYGRWIPNN